MTTTTPKKFKPGPNQRKLIRALRNVKEYKQCRGTNGTGPDDCCVAGLANLVAGHRKPTTRRCRSGMTRRATAVFGFRSRCGQNINSCVADLMWLNDFAKLTFPQLADELETNIHLYCTGPK